MDLTGRLLKNRYQVEAYLGRGGMAEVYKAYDTRRSYPVAIKVMHADLAEDYEFVRRFRQEAESLATLAHENIVRFYSFEKEGLLIFLVMDYVEGVTLRHLLSEHQQRLPLGQICHIFPPLCQALHYAHEEGFIHRDVKPGNVMIRPDGQVLLTDFGIAKATDAATLTTYMPGTPAYMSPEQCRANATIDRRSDVYALGIILFELLTGKRPFIGETESSRGSTREKIRWEQMHASPPDPRTYNVATSEELAQVVLNALYKNPVERFPTAVDMLTNFQLAMTDISPIIPSIVVERTTPSANIEWQTPSPSMSQNTDKPRISPLLLQYALIGIVTVILILAGGWLLSRQPQVNSPIVSITTVLPTPKNSITPTAKTTPIEYSLQTEETSTLVENETTPINGSAKVINKAILREGPSDLYPHFGELKEEALIEVIGRNKKGTWWQIIHPSGPNGRAWIDADEANIDIDPLHLAVVLNIPPMPTETPTPTVTPTSTPTMTPLPTSTSTNVPTPISTSTPPPPSHNSTMELNQDTNHLSSIYQTTETVFLSTDAELFRIIVAVQDQNGSWQKGIQLIANSPDDYVLSSEYSTDYPSVESPPHPTITRYGNIEIAATYTPGYWDFYLVDETGQQVSERFSFEFAGDAKIWLFFTLSPKPN